MAGRPYLVTGGTGSGKSLLGLSFLLEGLRLGEEVLLVAVDEPPNEIVENVRAFGWDLSAVRTLDANPGTRAIKRMADVQEIRALADLKSMRDLSSEQRKAGDADDISIQSIHLKLRQQMGGGRFTRVVVDSLTSIRRFGMKTMTPGDMQPERTEVQSLLRFLSEMEVTTLLTATPGKSDGPLAGGDPDPRGDPSDPEVGRRPLDPPDQDRPHARVGPRPRAASVRDHPAGIRRRVDPGLRRRRRASRERRRGILAAYMRPGFMAPGRPPGTR